MDLITTSPRILIGTQRMTVTKQRMTPRSPMVTDKIEEMSRLAAESPL